MASKQIAPTRRMVTILQLLATSPLSRIDPGPNAGRDPGGLPADTIIHRLAPPAGTPKSHRDQLARDIRYLVERGHDISNVAEDGEPARYVLRPGDDRFRVALSSSQHLALARAAVLVGSRDVLEGEVGAADRIVDVEALDLALRYRPLIPEELGLLQRAVAQRCLTRFTYSGRPRTVHPVSLGPQSRGWVLAAQEDSSGVLKHFSVHKMTDVGIDSPGSAAPTPEASRASVDPLTWEVDEPATAQLLVPARFVADVARLLGDPQVSIAADVPDEDESVELRFRVTNRRVFLARLFELGQRVRLLGDDALRAEARRLLVAVADQSQPAGRGNGS